MMPKSSHKNRTGLKRGGGQVKSGDTGDFPKRNTADILFKMCYKNSRGMDLILKKHFDTFRDRGEMPPGTEAS